MTDPALMLYSGPNQERGILNQTGNMDYALKIDELKEKGLSKHKEGKYSEAVTLFSEGYVLCLSTNYSLASILQYRADSYLQQKDYNNALKDARESMQLNNSSLEIFLIAAKALEALGNHTGACEEYLHAYRSVVTLEKNSIFEVLTGLTSLLSRSPETVCQQLMIHTRRQIYMQRNMWAWVCYHHIKNKEWKEAHIAFKQFEYDEDNLDIVSMNLSLKPFSTIKEIRSHPWVADIILHLLKCGSDKTDMTLEKGDTYMHAAVRIAMVAACPHLLQYLIEDESKLAADILSMTDSHGNTLLHTATKERKVDKKERNKVLTIVLKFGVDPHARNKDNRLAISNLSDEKNKNLIRTFYKPKEKEVQQKATCDDAVSDKSRRKYKHKRKKQKNQKEKEPSDSICKECQQIYNDAVDKLKRSKMEGLSLQIKLFNMDHNNQKHSSLVQAALKQFVECIGELNQNDILKCMESLRREKYDMIIESLVEHKKWISLDMIMRSYNTLVDAKILQDLCSNLSLDTYLENISQTEEEDNIRIIDNLLDCGWSLGNDDGRSLIKTVVDSKQFKLATELLNHDIDCSLLSVYEGDTPLHAAIQIAIQQERPSVLRVLLERYRSDKDLYAYLDPDQVDINGDNVRNLLTKYNNNEAVKELKQILHEMVFSNGEQSKDMNITESKSTNKLSSASATKVAENTFKQKSRYQLMMIPKSEQLEEIKDRIIDLISSLKSKSGEKSDEIILYSRIKSPQNTNKVKTETKLDNTRFASKKGQSFEQGTLLKARNNNIADYAAIPSHRYDDGVHQDRNHIPDADASSSKFQGDNETLDTEGDTNVVEEDNQIFYADGPMLNCTDDDNISCNKGDKTDVYECLDLKNAFKDLTWEVEYTDKVRRKLSKVKDPKIKFNIMRIIRRLADGYWQNSYCKKLKMATNSFDLFEAKINKGCRIIWEKAISFSPRLNDCPVSSSDTCDGNAPERPGDKLYTEVIRVWDIVLDHDKIGRSVKKIIDAHKRGESSQIRRQLKGINKGHKKENEIKCPLCFVQNDNQDSSSYGNRVLQYYPPASPLMNEYNILKFYTWDETFERHVLQNGNKSIEFPFKVTEKEDAIIRINETGPILLMGRSGTGKTTCCLFRLWNEYRNRKILPENVENPRNHVDIEEQQENREDGVDDIDTPANLHQLFLTKNHVLVSEVKETFKGFLKSNRTFQNCKDEDLDKNVPYAFEKLRDESFPLFLTSRQFLCRLDGSIKEPFFTRKEDGSLKYLVEGWSDDPSTAVGFLDYDYEDEEFDDPNDFKIDVHEEKQENLRKEITYDVFENNIWPLMVNKTSTRTKYHPSLVWTEIMSFIKGSYESLNTISGNISRKKYIELGMKRAPNFTGDREEVYNLFEMYERVKKRRRMFDENDVVFNIFKQLDDLDTCPIKLHQIYVDEVQDFTQAELFLVIRLCQNPNNMFFTGDTAQSVMRGISFRFEDLKCLFHHVSEVLEERKRSQSLKRKDLKVYVPKKVHKLIYNYRSHIGIVSLASSILDILGYFFSESFDHLDSDKGLLPGPEPILLESCSSSDLAILLCGNRRKTSTIEFGAHQVILVYDEDAKETLPEELSCGLVLTIYEAKGLEFDDVLLYNFFKNSQASDEWRVVTQYLNDLSVGERENISQNSVASVIIDQDVLELENRPRPLQFDPNQHKILGTELKLLYTALTRARVNVWIFDENTERRKPIFEYLEARKLVKTVRITDLSDESISNTVFVEKSTEEDWIKRGEYFKSKRRYGVAATCFRKGGDKDNMMLAQGHHYALLASRKRYEANESKQMKAEFLFAAEMFLKCEQYSDTAKCLNNAKEVDLLTDLYENLGQFDKAALVCRRHKQFSKSSKFYERSSNYTEAVAVLFENKLYHLAFNVFERCKISEEEMSHSGNALPAHKSVMNPDASYTEDKICKRAAEEFHKCDQKELMHRAVSKFHMKNDRIEFYKTFGYISDAARELESKGNFKAAVDLYLMYGKFTEAKDIAERSQNDKDLAKCLLIMSRYILQKEENDDEKQTKTHFDVNKLQGYLEHASKLFHKCKDRSSEGQVKLLQAQVYGDQKYVDSAVKCFTADRTCPNKEGYLECCIAGKYLPDEEKNQHFLLKGFDFMFDVCKNLLKRDHKSCLFYGMYTVSRGGKTCLVVYPKENPLCATLLPKVRKSQQLEIKLLNTDIEQIVKNLLKKCKAWTGFLKDSLLDQRSSKLADLTQIENDDDMNLGNLVYAADTKFQQLISTNLLLVKYEFCIDKADGVLKKSCNFLIKASDRFETCKFFLKYLVQHPNHPCFLAASTNVVKTVSRDKFKLFDAHMKKFLSWRFTEAYKYFTSGKPDKAVKSFQPKLSKNELKNKTSDPDGQLVSLEFFLTIAFFIIAKVESNEDTEFHFYIPNNYIALLYFIESSLKYEQQFSILQTISRLNQTRENAFLDCVSRFESVISSQMEKQILKIDDRELKIILLERLVILHHTMLCNLGKCVSFSCRKSLVDSSSRIHKHLISLKSPNQQCISNEQQFKNIQDVAIYLQEFLNSRDMGETLQSVVWNEKLPALFTASAINIQEMPTDPLEDVKCKSENNESATSDTAGKSACLDYENKTEWPTLEKEVETNTSENIGKLEKGEKINEIISEENSPQHIPKIFLEKNEKLVINFTNSKSEETFETVTPIGSEENLLNRDLQSNSNTNTVNWLNDNYLEAKENNIKDDQMTTLAVRSVDTVFIEIASNTHECGVCGVSFINSETVDTDNVTVEDKFSHSEDYNDQQYHIEDQANDDKESFIPDKGNIPDNAVSKRRQEHEEEQAHHNNKKIFKKFEATYNDCYKPVLLKVNECLQDSRFNLYDNNFISKHFGKYKDEIERMTSNNDTLLTNMIKALRERTWDAEESAMREIAETLQRDFDVIYPYVTSVTDKVLKDNYSCSSEMNRNVSVKEEDLYTNEFEAVALEPSKKNTKYMTKKERRDKKKQHGKKK